MNILIVCDYYPPDTAIAAVRPYMMAKYLSLYGHRVTVIRSGELSQMPDNSIKKLENVNVISLFGEKSAADLFERGEKIILSNKSKPSMLFIPLGLRDLIKRIYRIFMAPVHIYRLRMECKRRVDLFNDLMNLRMKDENIDIVFSTCGGISVVAEGRCAADFFKSKWIADFRDTMVQPLANSWVLNRFFKNIQDDTVRKADAITAVSKGVAHHLSNGHNRNNIHVIYNGYEDKAEYEVIDYKTEKGKLKFCYTGRIYSERLKAFRNFAKVMKTLVNEKTMDIKNIEFIYAGPDSVVVQNELQYQSIDSILVDRGYVTRTEVMDIQAQADIFLVLSWNTKHERGILTGKFYEGIRAHKVILSFVTGGEPDSELFELNKKYRYGYYYLHVFAS